MFAPQKGCWFAAVVIEGRGKRRNSPPTDVRNYPYPQ